jgi:ribosomal-protein-alanine N-acetyltransferase
MSTLKKFPELKSKRLTLRLATIEDLEDIHYLHSFPEVDEFNTTGIPENLAQTKTVMMPLFAANLKSEKYTIIVNVKGTDTFVGMVGVFPGKPKYDSAEVWYKILPKEWGKGYATEILQALIQFCFKTLKAHRVEAGCAVKNLASIRVMEKAGMKQEGRRRQTLPLATGWSDNFEYAILDVD